MWSCIEIEITEFCILFVMLTGEVLQAKVNEI